MGKVSFNAKNLSAGGLVEGDVSIVDVTFKEDDYEGSARITAVVEYLAEEGGEPTPRFYGVGKKNAGGIMISVSADGKDLEFFDDEREYRVSERSGFGKFLAALENAGFPTTRLDDEGWSALIGERFHVESVPSGTKSREGQDKTILLPTKYLGGGSPKKGSKAAKAAPKKGGKAEAAVDVDEVAAAALLRYLSEADEPLTLNDIQRTSFRDKELKKNVSQRKAIMERLIDPEFLSLQDGWLFDEEEGTVEAD